MNSIPLARPDFDEREVDAARRVLQSGWVVQGPEVEAFEAVVAAMHQARHCVAVSSGTAALHIAYLSMGIGPGDAVFVPSFAWPSAANMAMLVGTRPVYVDVLPDTYNIDPADLRRRIEECRERGWGRPRAVVPVHEFGLAADMKSVLETAVKYHLEVVEDAACALGATYHGRPVGTLGRLGIFSFHPRKAITTGEGGAIVTNDDDLADRCRSWRNHGQQIVDGNRDFALPGLNYRMTEFQAAIGSVQLSKFPEILEKRRRLAARYLERLIACPGLTLPTASPEHTWQTFMVVLDGDLDRAQVLSELSASGIGAGPGSIAAHCTALYRERYGYRPEDLPRSAEVHRQGVAVPLHSCMDDRDVERCCLQLAQATRPQP